MLQAAAGIGAQLLRHVLEGSLPQFSRVRAKRSLTLLANELERQFGQHFVVARNYETGVGDAPLVIQNKTNGSKARVDIHSPIAPSIPIYGTTNASTVLVDDFRIRRHLGEEVERVATSLK